MSLVFEKIPNNNIHIQFKIDLVHQSVSNDLTVILFI